MDEDDDDVYYEHLSRFAMINLIVIRHLLIRNYCFE
jgi:hypothetical protein